MVPRALRATPTAQVPAVGLLALLCLVSATMLVVLGSRLTFYLDDWAVLAWRPGLNEYALFTPHIGHPIVFLVLIFKGLVALFGLDAQVPFRITLALFLVTLAVLVFAFVRERAGDLLGLLAAAVLLFLGSASDDLLWLSTLNLVGSLVTGVGVLLALERGTRRADLVACLLLVASIGFSNLGISFIIAAAVVVLLRWRASDLWIPGVPALLYAAWWLRYSKGDDTGFSLSYVPRLPFYVLDAISAGLASLTGLRTSIGGEADAYAYGRPLLAVAAVGTMIWLWRGGRPSARVLPIAAAALSFWVLLGLNYNGYREPDMNRYQLVSVTFLILFAAEFFRPVRLSRLALAGVAVATVLSIGSNLGMLKDGYQSFRVAAAIAKAELGALDIGRQHISRQFVVPEPFEGQFYLTNIFAESYFRERDAHGSPAYSPTEIAAAEPPAPSAADVVLASGYGLQLQPAAPSQRPGGADGCRTMAPSSNANPGELALPPGGAGLTNLGPAATGIRLRRFAQGDFPVDLGQLDPGASARLAIPEDRVSRPWRLGLDDGSSIEVCRLQPEE